MWLSQIKGVIHNCLAVFCAWLISSSSSSNRLNGRILLPQQQHSSGKCVRCERVRWLACVPKVAAQMGTEQVL